MSLEKAGGVPLLVSERVMAQKGLALSSLLKAVFASESIEAALRETVEVIRKSVGALSVTIALDHQGKKHSVRSLPVVDEKVRPDALSKTPASGFLMATGSTGLTPVEGYPVTDFSPHDGFDGLLAASPRNHMEIPFSDSTRGLIEWLLDEQAPAPLVQAFMTIIGEDLALLFADVLKRQQRREKMARLEHIGKLAEHFAHDVRSPLTALAMVSSEFPPDPEMLQAILENVGQTAKVYGDLFLSRGPVFSQQQLPDVVRKALHEIQSFPDVQEKELVWQVTFEGSDLPAMMNEALLKNAVQNLLQNSAHFAPKGGAVSVVVKHGVFPQADTYSEPAVPAILIEVQDDGPGISREQQGKLFHESTTTRPGGHGVGLQSVYHTITQLHHGRVYLQSQTGPGSFTRFTIALPALADAALALKSSPAGRPDSLEVLRGMTVVMNEDDSNVTKLLKSLFSTAGILSRSLERLDEFLKALQDLPEGSVALLDQQTKMGIDAIPLAAIIKRRRPDMLVILCSGTYSDHDQPPYPFDGAVAKPFHQDALFQLLADLIREKRRKAIP